MMGFMFVVMYIVRFFINLVVGMIWIYFLEFCVRLIGVNDYGRDLGNKVFKLNIFFL